MNNDYKNGYNRAVEVLLMTIDRAINSKKTGYESINDVVLGIKRDLIKSAYMKDDPQFKASVHFEGGGGGSPTISSRGIGGDGASSITEMEIVDSILAGESSKAFCAQNYPKNHNPIPSYKTDDGKFICKDCGY